MRQASRHIACTVNDGGPPLPRLPWACAASERSRTGAACKALRLNSAYPWDVCQGMQRAALQEPVRRMDVARTVTTPPCG